MICADIAFRQYIFQITVEDGVANAKDNGEQKHILRDLRLPSTYRRLAQEPADQIVNCQTWRQILAGFYRDNMSSDPAVSR